MSLEVGTVYRVAGGRDAANHIGALGYDKAAYLGFGQQLFNELNIRAVEAESKQLGKHDGRNEVASLGQFSPPAGAALLAAQEIAR